MQWKLISLNRRVLLPTALFHLEALLTAKQFNLVDPRWANAHNRARHFRGIPVMSTRADAKYLILNKINIV